MSSTRNKPGLILTLLAALLTSLTPTLCLSDVGIMLPPGNSEALAIAHQIQLAIDNSSVVSPETVGKSPPDTLVALGSNALELIPQGALDQTTVLAAFVGEDEFAAWKQTHSRAKATAVLSNSSLDKQLELVRQLLHSAKVGVIYSPKSQAQVERLYARHLPSSNLTITAREAPAGNPVPTILKMINQDKIDTIIMVRDEDLYPQESLRPLLEMGYRQRIGIFTYSPALVRAGALGATYYSRTAVTEETIQLLRDMSRHGPLPAPRFPSTVSVEVNDSYARSVFDLIVQDRTSLEGLLNGH